VTSRVDAATRIRSSLVPVIGLVAVLGITFLRVLTVAGVSPSGIDGGNWLAFGSVERAGVAYPPIVPFLFSELVALVGPTVATSIAAAMAIGLPAIAILALATWAGRPMVGVFAALFVVASPILGEAIAWGGYPQPIATAAAVLALAALAAYIRDGRLQALGVFGIAFAVVAGTSHLVAVPTALAAIVIVVAHLRRSRTSLLRGTRAGLVACVPLALLAPTYLALFATLGLVSPSGSDVARILGPYWLAYPAVLALVVVTAMFVRVGPIQMLNGRDRVLLATAGAASIAWAAAFVASGEPRLLYDLPTLVPLGVIALIPVAASFAVTPRMRLGLAAATLAICMVFVGSGLSAFPAQVAFYHVMTPGELAAMRWLGNQPIAADEVLVADRAGVPLGWWAEGLIGRQELYASELRWLRFDAERERSRTANVLLYQSGFPDSASAARMVTAGIHYVLLPYGSAFGIESAGPAAGWSVAFESGDALVLAPNASLSVAAP
jgi:hypothetical protein